MKKTTLYLMKNLKTITAVVVLNLISMASFAQVWDGSGINTWTYDNVGIGTSPTDASLDIITPFPGYYTNGVSLRIYNDRCTDCALNTPQGWSVVPNVMEIFERTYSGLTPDNISMDVDHPYFVVDENGRVGIGVQPDPTYDFNLDVNGTAHFNDKVVLGDITLSTQPTGFRLYVDDGILTKRVKVAVPGGTEWPDYVFSDDYSPMSLMDVEDYLKENKHLPGVPSAEEVSDNGIDLGKMDATLLRKIEELTLHMIELKKENDELRKRVEQLEK